MINGKRTFTQLSKAWYKNQLQWSEYMDVVLIGIYHPEGGTSAEFKVVWEYLGGEAVPRLCVYDDAWGALPHFSDLLKAMEDLDDKNVTPGDFCKLLVSLGIEDATETEMSD